MLLGKLPSELGTTWLTAIDQLKGSMKYVPKYLARISLSLAMAGDDSLAKLRWSDDANSIKTPFKSTLDAISAFLVAPAELFGRARSYGSCEARGVRRTKQPCEGDTGSHERGSIESTKCRQLVDGDQGDCIPCYPAWILTKRSGLVMMK